MRRDAFVSPQGVEWERVRVDDPAQRGNLEGALAELRTASPGLTLFHEPAWLIEAEDRSAADVRIYCCRQDGVLAGYAAFVVQPWQMRFRFGEVTLAASKWERWHMNGGPVMAPGLVHREEESFSSLLTAIRRELAPRQLVYLEGVRVGGAVERAVRGSAISAAYRVFEPSPRYERSTARLPDTFDAYLQTMKSQTRQNLRNSRRKLERHIPLGLARFTESSRMREFVTRAVAVSRKTYQWRLLGLGLRDGDKLERTLEAMAKRGFARCYLLECGGDATAFMIGYLHEGVYYYVDVGFDPDWEKWSVGTVLHMDVMKDLIEHAGAKSFDFSSGTGVHKKRFGTETTHEASFALMPATLASRALIAGYRATDAVSGAASAALERLHVKARLKRLVRRTASAGEPGQGD